MIAPVDFDFKHSFTSMGSEEGSGQAVLPFFFLFDSILRLFYFYPTYLVDVTPWARKPKKNYSKEDSNR